MTDSEVFAMIADKEMVERTVRCMERRTHLFRRAIAARTGRCRRIA